MQNNQHGKHTNAHTKPNLIRYFQLILGKIQDISKVACGDTHTENGNTWSLLINLFNKSTSDRIQQISEVVFKFAHKGQKHVFLSR